MGQQYCELILNLVNMLAWNITREREYCVHFRCILNLFSSTGMWFESELSQKTAREARHKTHSKVKCHVPLECTPSHIVFMAKNHWKRDIEQHSLTHDLMKNNQALRIGNLKLIRWQEEKISKLYRWIAVSSLGKFDSKSRWAFAHVGKIAKSKIKHRQSD